MGDMVMPTGSEYIWFIAGVVVGATCILISWWYSDYKKGEKNGFE